MDKLATSARISLGFDATTFILGLGYVMGLRSSMILCAGGVFSNFVLVPLVWMLGSHFPDIAVHPGKIPISQMEAADIFRNYARFVGVGAIATAGIFGIVKSLRVVASSIGVAARAFKGGEGASLERTDRDISIMAILLGVVLSTVAVAVLLGMLHSSLAVAAIGVVLVLFFSFFFTSVAALVHRHHRAQSRLGHDHAHHHRVVGGAAPVRAHGHHRHVLRDDDRGHGVHGALGVGAGHHRSQDRLLAGFDAVAAGAHEVHRHRRVVRGRGADHRAAREGVSIRRSGRGRSARPCSNRRRPPS